MAYKCLDHGDNCSVEAHFHPQRRSGLCVECGQAFDSNVEHYGKDSPAAMGEIPKHSFQPPSETAALVARLDGTAANAAGVMHTVHAAIEREAATALEQQQAEIERLKEAVIDLEFQVERRKTALRGARLLLVYLRLVEHDNPKSSGTITNAIMVIDDALKEAASDTPGTGSPEQALSE